MFVIGIVGFKNSGKTYLAQQLITYYTNKKMKVASIKHAHHQFEIDKENTDSFLHKKAGSKQIIISSSKRWAKIVELNDQKEKNLNELLLEVENSDIVIVEGYKNESHPKIEIIKKKSKEFLFNKINNVVAIVSNEKIDTEIKQFNIENVNAIAEFVLQKNYKI